MRIMYLSKLFGPFMHCILANGSKHLLDNNILHLYLPVYRLVGLIFFLQVRFCMYIYAAICYSPSNRIN